jgi:hypothetical protein
MQEEIQKEPKEICEVDWDCAHARIVRLKVSSNAPTFFVTFSPPLYPFVCSIIFLIVCSTCAFCQPSGESSTLSNRRMGEKESRLYLQLRLESLRVQKSSIEEETLQM